MENDGMLYLRADEHGYYMKHRKARKKAAPALYVSTNRQHQPYALVHGIAVNLFDEPRIILVRNQFEHLHAEFAIVGGARVVTWEEDVIRELWKLGVAVTVYSDLQAFIAERQKLRQTGQCWNWPPLYELESIPS